MSRCLFWKHDGITGILYGKEPEHAVKPDEVPVPEAGLRKFIGTYLSGKIHIELYCIGLNTFIRRHEEQSYTHNLLPEGADKPAVWGYERVSEAFI